MSKYEKIYNRVFWLVAVLIVAGLTASACTSQADTASANLSRAAEQFEVNRRVVFMNGITDTYMLSIEGLCLRQSAPVILVKCLYGLTYAW